MPERRYSRYKRDDVWIEMMHYQSQLGIRVVADSVYGNSVTIVRLKDEEGNKCAQEHRAVILARSSDWYFYSLNCTDRYLHGITAIVTGTHDSCIDRPVLALDVMRWYESSKMRADFGALTPTIDEGGNPVPDTFDQKRKTQYGSNMLLGALMQRRPDALARLSTLAPRTRMRYEQKMRKLTRRRVGHPFVVWPVDKPTEKKTSP
jgi:hypothetical protein